MERRLGDRELYVYSIPAWSLDIIINIHDRFLFLTWFSSCRGGTCGTSLSKSTGTQKLWRAYRYSKGSYQMIFLSVLTLSLSPSLQGFILHILSASSEYLGGFFYILFFLTFHPDFQRINVDLYIRLRHHHSDIEGQILIDENTPLNYWPSSATHTWMIIIMKDSPHPQ